MREDLLGKHGGKTGDNDMLSTECCIEWQQLLADHATLEVDSTSFEGVLHDNLSNKKRLMTPLGLISNTSSMERKNSMTSPCSLRDKTLVT